MGFGSNEFGQICTRLNGIEWHLVQVGTDNDWQFISTSCIANHSFGIKTDGSLWGWGLNDSGQLGNGTTVNSALPVQTGTDT
jgi:alpha-tubulin suppressor-like RCC1 family protein